MNYAMQHESSDCKKEAELEAYAGTLPYHCELKHRDDAIAAPQSGTSRKRSKSYQDEIFKTHVELIKQIDVAFAQQAEIASLRARVEHFQTVLQLIADGNPSWNPQDRARAAYSKRKQKK